MKRITTAFMLWMALLPAMAQLYDATHIKKAVESLKIDTALLAQPGVQYAEVKGQRLVVRTSAAGVVEHIGIPLFTQQMRTLVPSPIYDFLEYATMDHKYHINENTLQLQEVTFSKGSWQQLEQLGDTLPCTIDNIEEKSYKVTWHNDSADIVSVNFPVNYELLANSNRREIEARFVEGLKAYHDTTAVMPLHVDQETLVPTEKEGIYVAEGDSYAIPAINGNIYFIKSKEGVPRPVYDGNYAAESLANLLLAPMPAAEDASIELSVSYCTHRSEKITVALRDFLAFCLQQGCKPFFGYEGTTKGNAMGTLILSNRAAGYNHILHLECPIGSLGGSPLQKASAYIFTPSSNVKNLFADKNTRTKSIVIWK